MNSLSKKSEKRDQLARILGKMIVFGLFFFLALIPFHLVIKKIIPDPVGTYWKEILLGVLMLISILYLMVSRNIVLPKDRLSLAIAMYVAIILLRLITDRSGIVAWWGLYFSVMYLPLFYVVFLILEDWPQYLRKFLFVIVMAGAIISLGGIIEFLLNRAFWPSVELTIRQGFPDMYIYGTHIRRVYFVLDSPTTLANTLALILPFSLAFLFESKKMFQRVLFAFASIIIFSCIIFTFSRGIWVALAIVFVPVIILFLGMKDKKWAYTFLVVVVLLGIVVVIVLGNRSSVQMANEKYTYELNESEYNNLSLQNIRPLINLESKPDNYEIQEWSLSDPIINQIDTRPVLFMHPISDQLQDEIILPVDIAQSNILRFSIAMAREVWTPEKGDGVTFKIFLQDLNDSSNDKFVFVRYINPKSNPSDRRWRNYYVDLSEFENQNVFLHLITQSGPDDNYNFDWAGWGELELGRVQNIQGIKAISEKTNPILTHVRSIFNWGSDETNRDRLLAWNLGFATWKKAPFWGMGLGTTGAAALRTSPESAFVTESQILKSVVELGVPGFIIYLFLWFEIIRSLIRIYRDKTNTNKLIILALASSLLVIFIEGLVYQNLEVKQVNAYFWLLIGILVFLNNRLTKTGTIDPL